MTAIYIIAQNVSKNNLTKEEASYFAQALNINQDTLSRHITKEEKTNISEGNKPNAKEQKMEELLKRYNGKEIQSIKKEEFLSYNLKENIEKK